MSIDRLDQGLRIAGAGAIALFVVMFFPWFGRSAAALGAELSLNVTAWQAFQVIDVILLAAVALTLGLLYLVAREREIPGPLGASTLITGAGALATLLVIYRILDTPFELDRRYGVFLGLVAAAGILAGGRMAMGERGESFSGAGETLQAEAEQARRRAADAIDDDSPRYEDWTVDDLREEAAKRDIEGRSEMNKDELIAALRRR